MKIGVIGSGHIGATATRLFIMTGHEVGLSNSRGPETLQNFVKDYGNQLKPTTVDGSGYFGEVVLIAIPFREYRTITPDTIVGKIVIDAMNYYPDRDGHIPELDSGEATSSELLAKHLNESKIVKAFNTICYKDLDERGNLNAPVPERTAIFLAGDDPAAKRVVANLIEQIGFAPVDTGSLAEGGRRQQPGTPLYNHPMTQQEGKLLVYEEVMPRK